MALFFGLAGVLGGWAHRVPGALYGVYRGYPAGDLVGTFVGASSLEQEWEVFVVLVVGACLVANGIRHVGFEA